MDSADLSALLAQLVRQYRIPGAQLAVRFDGRTITAEAGEESAGMGRLVTGKSAFPLGSLTKPFTATMVMMLVDDGDVELDVPIAKYLPELGTAMTGGVTLRQVLSHTSGLVANVEETASGTTRRRWVENHAENAVAHPPGAGFSYSNVGYLLLGHLVEVITGMTWRQAMEAILLRPLGIAPAFVLGRPDRLIVDGHVVRPNAPAVPIAEQTVTHLEEPVAALAGSAADLVAFAVSHLSTPRGVAVLAGETAEEMREDQLTGMAAGAFGLADGWGLGWSLYRRAGLEWFGHDGTGDGAWSHLRVEPESGTVVALVTNAGNGQVLWDAVVEWLRSTGLDVANYSMVELTDPGPPIPGPPECAGNYANGAWTYTVEAEAGHLYLSLDSEPRAKVICFQDLRFTTVPGSGATPLVGRFLRDPETANVNLLQITGRLARRTGTWTPARE